MSRITLYTRMTLHVSSSAASYIFGKAAAVGLEDAAVLTLARALGAAVIFLLGTGTLIPRPRFAPREWLPLLGFGILLVPCNQYCFLRGLQYTVPSQPALFYALTPLGVKEAVDPIMRGLFLVVQKWTDTDGVIWYKVKMMDMHGTQHQLTRISPKGDSLEFVQKRYEYPKTIDQENLNCSTYSRSPAK